MQRAETTGAAFGPSRVAGTAGVEALVIDLGASLRPGNAGINTAAVPLAVLDQALALSSVRR